jgi:hypothetical protein
MLCGRRNPADETEGYSDNSYKFEKKEKASPFCFKKMPLMV